MISLQPKFSLVSDRPISMTASTASFRGRFGVVAFISTLLLVTNGSSLRGMVSAAAEVSSEATAADMPLSVDAKSSDDLSTAGKTSFSGRVIRVETTESACAKPDLKTNPEWVSKLENGNLVLPKLIQAISGRTNSEETVKLLRGVVKILREERSFKLVREDSNELRFGPDTILGDRINQSLERTKRDTDKYSQNLGSVITGLNGVLVNGNHVELLRDGPEDLRIALSAGKKLIPIKLKEIHLTRLSMDLDESKGYPSVRNINGLEVIVTAGVEFHITLKEFSRTKNAKGDTTVTFGILNPLPKAIRVALGLNEISYFSHTIRKKVERPA